MALLGLAALAAGWQAAAAVSLYPLANDPFANPLQQQAWTKPPQGLSVRNGFFSSPPPLSHPSHPPPAIACTLPAAIWPLSDPVAFRAAGQAPLVGLPRRLQPRRPR